MEYKIEIWERRLNMEVEQVDRSLDWQNGQLSLALGLHGKNQPRD